MAALADRDIRRLFALLDEELGLRHLNIDRYEQAVAVITRFYPLERFPQKTLYALGELLPRQG
jgi:hypothetical protein